jgi:glycosyltransferase involved in cell wall biosynthesis
MKITLICCSIGKKLKELERLFDSLKNQAFQNIELIVIDQSGGVGVEELLKNQNFKLETLYFKSERGLSKGRNLGLKKATGDIIAFPDDDCWYDKDTLQKAESFFKSNKGIDILSGVALNEDNEIITGFMDYKNGKELTKYNMFGLATSITIFARRDVFTNVGFFDEKMGVGSGTIYGSSEEHDFLARSMDAGLKCVFRTLVPTNSGILSPPIPVTCPQ